MANTIQTLTAGDITRKALAILHNNLVFTKVINRQYDDRFARSGAKNGGYLEIREPNQFTVRSGQTMDTQDVVEETTQLVLATQKGVDVNFSSVELTLSLDDFAERILNPAMARLAAEVDKTIIYGCYPYVGNLGGTLGTTSLASVRTARAKLSKGLAPTSDRFYMMESLAGNEIVASAGSYFHTGSEISKQFDTGLVGQMYGFKFYETEMTPTHTNGTRTDTTPTCDMSSMANSSGISYLMMTANAAGTTILPGDICFLADCYACNPETKVRYPHLQQFSVTVTAAGTAALTTINISPKIYTSGPKQNVVLATISTSTTVTWQAAGGSGTAGASYIHSIAFHRDAFTAVFADLEMPQGVHFAAREVYDGISLRIVRNFDIVNDRFPCRIDVLFGYKCLRPGWACRVTN
jgi:hypothetical protein